MKRLLLVAPIASLGVYVAFAASTAPTVGNGSMANPSLFKPAVFTTVDYKVPDRIPDVAQILPPSEVHLEGFLGQRVANNEKGRLLEVDENDLLDAFERRDVSHQDWQGEHVGKFLHAATLAWVNTGDPALKAKLDRVVARLIKTQEADGYLGTYPTDRRWTSWDVWVHKYDLIGLLTYYHYTGNQAALDASRKVGDLLINTFPAKKSIIHAGEHVGMAATSVLEAIVLLYRTTGDGRYLDFAKYIVNAWNEPDGPKIIKTLTTEKKVNKTANGKAYEMLSNLVGLCELARATGDRQYLQPVINAWEDVVAHQLYITGTASHGEHFHDDYDLPNQPGSNLGETCVTVTWIQLNQQLLRLTGDARYGDELERSYLNHLAGAQRPDGSEWCYYTPLEGTKPYGHSTNCCLSSGPRGMALAPTFTYLKHSELGQDNIAVNFFETSQVTTQLGGQAVTLEQQTDFPKRGVSTLTFRMKQPATFGLLVRSPAWAQPLKVRGVKDKQAVTGPAGGWAKLTPRKWKNGDQVSINFSIPARLIQGEHTNAGREALMWGPLVLAYDASQNHGVTPSSLALVETSGQPPLMPKFTADSSLSFEAPVRTKAEAQPKPATFVPFADAGSTGGQFEVWMHTPESLPQNLSLFASGHESRSRAGNLNNSINDGDAGSAVVTFDTTRRDEDWFAVDVDAPVTVRRIVFAHGKSFHDGGWFDASAGKPRIQVQHEKGGAWETVGTLTDYPDTTATDAHGLKDGQMFTLKLQAPLQAVAVRVIGKPASGDNPAQAFASCGELQAFAN
ncbi:MAG: glycoside hydrolase family 127 protein [Abitibacteriaceae bacterium]|nr:glycoside hydrolase family 127 protein [Abditibacteriaceae bacterium]